MVYVVSVYLPKRTYSTVVVTNAEYLQVDLDWEYPGAPDRGGKKQDTANYVLLLETMRKTFDRSDRGLYGISFTIPSSYWYLRWFDIPSMVKYVDWINLMSYDLHGVWDSSNPIGSIVQGHTNLTEIKESVNLLWRNNVPLANWSSASVSTVDRFNCATKAAAHLGVNLKPPPPLVLVLTVPALLRISRSWTL